MEHADCLTDEAVAKRLGVCVGYVKRAKRGGGCSFYLAERLAHIYNCSMADFYKTGSAGHLRKTKTKHK